MKLSVVIPCLNESQTLEKAIGLARGLVDGVGGDGEVVVADNGSTDDSFDEGKATPLTGGEYLASERSISILLLKSENIDKSKK